MRSQNGLGHGFDGSTRRGGARQRGRSLVRASLRTVFACLALLVTALPVASQTSAALLDCDVEALQAAALQDTTVVSAEERTDPVPHCRIEGFVTVDNPGPWDVRWRLSLPENFGGRYVTEAQGGSAGNLLEPSPDRLMNGFAVESTDKGTDPQGGLDFSWRLDPAQAENFAHRGNHVSAQATQALTRAYYGVESLPRYIIGCSGGGQAGLNSIGVYGAEDYDGVIVGDTPLDQPYSNTFFRWSRIAQYIVENPDGWIPPELLLAAHAAILAEYDGADGVVDGIIWYPDEIDFDTDVLRSVGLTEAQVATFEFVTGAWDFPGAPVLTHREGTDWTNLGNWSSWLIGPAPPQFWLENPFSGPIGYFATDSQIRATKDDTDFLQLDLGDPQTFFDYYADPSSLVDLMTQYDHNEFRDGGGKVIFYQGIGDAAVVWQDLSNGQEGMALFEFAGRSGMNHPEAVVRLDKWTRFYSVPGWGHCGGSPGPADVPDRLLEAMVAWVENGEAPQGIVANRDERSFLLCPEPWRSRFQRGDVNEAANWKCRHPNWEGN